MADINARKRDERLVEDQAKLKQLNGVLQLASNVRMDDFKKQLRANSISNKKELEVKWHFLDFPNEFLRGVSHIMHIIGIPESNPNDN